MHDSIDWDDLRHFLSAAEAGGFGAGAKALGTQQSTVSRRVASLEAKLGAALFERSAAGAALTPLGRRVREEAGAMSAALRRVTDAAATAERSAVGLVRIALTETMAAHLVLPLVLPALLSAHPGLRVDLLIGDTAADLSRREADVAIRFFLTPSGELITKRVGRMETAVLAARKLARRLATTPPGGWPFISTRPSGSPAPEELWRESFAETAPRITTNSFHAQYEAVRAGLGVAVLPRLMARLGGLVELRLAAPPPPPVDVYLVTPRALRRVPRVVAVFDALERALRQLLQAGR